MADLKTRVSDLAARSGAQDKLILTLISGNVPNLNALTTLDKTSIIAALNELKAAVDAASGGGAGISDTSTSTASTWSSSKIQDSINASITALVGGAPGALDTLDELAQAFGDDPDAIATITASLANRLRVDAPQTLTELQKQQGRDNLGVPSSAELGDPDTDFVAIFEANLT